MSPERRIHCLTCWKANFEWHVLMVPKGSKMVGSLGRLSLICHLKMSIFPPVHFIFWTIHVILSGKWYFWFKFSWDLKSMKTKELWLLGWYICLKKSIFMIFWWLDVSYQLINKYTYVDQKWFRVLRVCSVLHRCSGSDPAHRDRPGARDPEHRCNPEQTQGGPGAPRTTFGWHILFYKRGLMIKTNH